MIDKLDYDNKGTYKVMTSYGTYYIIDMNDRRGKRIPAEGRGKLEADNDWFAIYSIQCEVGKPMRFECRGIDPNDWYTWRISTTVTSIEEYSDI